MTATRADTHDLDKLDRWRKGLQDPGAAPFPAIAIFLVTVDDRISHDVFREFRASFENRGAAFHHLVIFGQHGISTTVTGFLRRTGLDLDSLPALVLAAGPEARQAHLLALPAGSLPGIAGSRSGREPEPWRVALGRLESAADTGTAEVDYSGIPGVSAIGFAGESGPLDLMGLVSALPG